MLFYRAEDVSAAVHNIHPCAFNNSKLLATCAIEFAIEATLTGLRLRSVVVLLPLNELTLSNTLMGVSLSIVSRLIKKLYYISRTDLCSLI